jgi:hypothetical protein
MKLQFSLAAILKTITVAAIVFSGAIAYHQQSATGAPWSIIWEDAIVTAPLWIPFLFFAYAVGRKDFTIRLIVLLAIAEVTAIAAQWIRLG